MTDTQLLLTVGLPTLSVLIGILLNHSRSEALARSLRAAISEAKETLRAEMLRVEEVLDARLKHVEEELQK